MQASGLFAYFLLQTMQCRNNALNRDDMALIRMQIGTGVFVFLAHGIK
jgi:hypothetical protein